MSVGSTLRGIQRFWYSSYHNDEIKYRIVTGFIPSKGDVKQEFLYLQAKCKSSKKPIVIRQLLFSVGIRIIQMQNLGLCVHLIVDVDALQDKDVTLICMVSCS